MTFTQEELDYLASQRLGRLATVDGTGAPQNSPVGFRYEPDSGTIAIGGRNLGQSRKFRNVRATGVVSFVVDDIVSTDPWRVRGVEIRGDAEALTDVDPGTPYGSRELIRIHPRRVISWGIDSDMYDANSRPVPPT
jgi:pyridoxamine 5'-phosphate oxidase family protein